MLNEWLLRQQHPGPCVEYVEGSSARHRHRDMPLLSANHEIGQNDVKILLLPFGCARLKVPRVLSGGCVDCDDGPRKQLAATGSLSLRRALSAMCSSGCKEQQTCLCVIGDRVPDGAAAVPPPLIAGPGVRGHRERLALKSLCRIARHGPE